MGRSIALATPDDYEIRIEHSDHGQGYTFEVWTPAGVHVWQRYYNYRASLAAAVRAGIKTVNNDKWLREQAIGETEVQGG